MGVSGLVEFDTVSSDATNGHFRPIGEVLPELQERPTPQKDGRDSPKPQNFLLVIHDANSATAKEAIEKHIGSQDTKRFSGQTMFITTINQLANKLRVQLRTTQIKNFGILDLRPQGLTPLLEQISELGCKFKTQVQSLYLAAKSKIESKLTNLLKANDLDFLEPINKSVGDYSLKEFINQLIKFVTGQGTPQSQEDLAPFERTIYQPESQEHKELFKFVDKILAA